MQPTIITWGLYLDMGNANLINNTFWVAFFPIAGRSLIVFWEVTPTCWQKEERVLKHKVRKHTAQCIKMAQIDFSLGLLLLSL